jgi:hypothetical protein
LNASSTTRLVLTGSQAVCSRCRTDFRWPSEWTPKFCPNCGRKNTGTMEATVPDQDLVDLVEKIRAECRRVELLLPIYAGIVPAGVLARDILQVVVREAEQSIASGDAARMRRALESLRNVPQ